MLETFGHWLGNSFLNDFMIDVGPAFPASETLHFIGLSLLFGSLILVDLRAMGFFKDLPFVAVHNLVTLAILGFAINLITGILFIAFDPMVYLVNAAFLWKMILIGIAGINALVFEFLFYRPIAAGNAALEEGVLIKFSAAISLILWCGVLILGRLIPFV